MLSVNSRMSQKKSSDCCLGHGNKHINRNSKTQVIVPLKAEVGGNILSEVLSFPAYPNIHKAKYALAALIIIWAILLSNSFAGEPIKVFFENKEVTFDQPPVIQNGRTLVPMRAIFEAIGVVVKWHPETQSVLAYNNSTYMEFKIGSDLFVTSNVNSREQGTFHFFEVTPITLNGRILVPLRTINDTFDCGRVDWSNASKTIKIGKYIWYNIKPVTVNFDSPVIVGNELPANKTESYSGNSYTQNFSIGDTVLAYNTFIGTIIAIKDSKAQVLWTGTTSKSAAYVADKGKSTGITIGSSSWLYSFLLSKYPY